MANKWYMTWEEVNSACVDLVHTIQEARFTPTTIVAVAKGGIIPAGIVHQFFPQAHIIVLRVSSYFKGQQFSPPVIHNPEVLTFVDPEKTLVVDDICDSGNTFEALRHGVGQDMKYAAMLIREGHDNPSLCDFKKWVAPHGWVTFPWEENITEMDLAVVR